MTTVLNEKQTQKGIRHVTETGFNRGRWPIGLLSA